MLCYLFSLLLLFLLVYWVGIGMDCIISTYYKTENILLKKILIV